MTRFLRFENAVESEAVSQRRERTSEGDGLAVWMAIMPVLCRHCDWWEGSLLFGASGGGGLNRQ